MLTLRVFRTGAFVGCMIVGAATAALPLVAAVQSPPAEVLELARKAHIEAPVVAWCGGQFQPRQVGAYAVAVAAPTGGGRYVVLQPDGMAVELAAFERAADLSCYTPAEARKLNASIRVSETIQGEIAPRWTTTVVCGFLDDTTSACWQYSPVDRKFVKIGGWTT